MVIIRELSKDQLEDILNVESKSFIPIIRADREIILNRLTSQHIYLGAYEGNKANTIIGIVGFRSAQFLPNFEDFISKYPTFNKWANQKSEANGNAFFVYSLGIMPNYRNGVIAKAMIQKVLDIALLQQKKYVVGDARIPSYNGGNFHGFEKIEQNLDLKKAIDLYLTEKRLLKKEKLFRDPIAGFYLNILPHLDILGATDSHFLETDSPAGGHRVIIYLRLK